MEQECTPSYRLIDAQAQVGAVVASVSGASRVAVDMEADSLHHYFEKVCLIQISAGGENFLIDALAGLDLGEVFDALAGKELLFHAADYDLRMLRRAYNFVATRIFDTMVAAKLLGYERIGLAALVETHFGVALTKHGQKADWSARPIREDLLAYAANDTFYLAELTDKFSAELEQAGRAQWHKECCERIRQEALAGDPPVDEDRVWRVKGWRQLESTKSLGVLRALWHWRDEEARRADLPPFRILSNETMVNVAKWAADGAMPDDRPKLPRNLVGRRLRKFTEAIEDGSRKPMSRHPRTPRESFSSHRPKPCEDLIKVLREARDGIALELKLDPSILAPAAAIEGIARQRPATIDALRESSGLYDWQAKVLAEPFLKLIAEPPDAAGK